MPVFNQERFVEQALRSVLEQRDVVAEVLVSDDASRDRTWPKVTEVVRAYRGPHRVVVIRQTETLRRDHLVELEALAECDIVVAAHGDDVSAPNRAKRVLEAFSSPEVTLISSSFIEIDASGSVTRSPFSDVEDDLELDSAAAMADVMDPDERIIGATFAWRRSAMAQLPRLNSAYAATGHDYALAFRAALVGRVVILAESLLQRRAHDESWSKGIWDWRSNAATRFGKALYLLSAYSAMSSDVACALEHGLISAVDGAGLRSKLDQLRGDANAQLLEVSQAMARDGRVVLWVTEHEARLAREGALHRVLARRAAVAKWVRRNRLAVRRFRYR
jgi:hypothetical protein